jgi:hypothetical protein
LSELAELYLFFLVIYLLECAVWVPRSAVGLFAPVRRWGWRRPWSPNTSWSRGALFGAPWPPLSSPLVAEPLPVTVGPDGLTYDGGRTHLAWTALEHASAAGARLEVNRRPVATLGTSRGAAALAAVLTELRKLPREARVGRIERLLDERFDVTATAVRLLAFRRGTRALRVVTNVLWVALFVAVPVSLWIPLGGIVQLLAGAVLVLLAWLASAVVFERTLRKAVVLPRALWPDLTKRVVAASSPLAAIRSADLIARELVGDIDPLAVAAALLPPTALADLARPRLVDLLFRQGSDLPEGAADDDRAWRQGQLERIRRLLRGRDLDPEVLLAAPPRDRDEVVAWCPRCLAQYEKIAAGPEHCPGDRCPGISLVKY